MNFTFTYRNLESSSALESAVKDGLIKTRKVINSAIDVHCVFTVEGYRHEVELTVRGAGRDFVAHDSSDDMYKAASGATNKLEKQIFKHFDKVRSH